MNCLLKEWFAISRKKNLFFSLLAELLTLSFLMKSLNHVLPIKIRLQQRPSQDLHEDPSESDFL